MSTRSRHAHSSRAVARGVAFALVAGLTFVAGTAQAIDVPAVPLQSGASYPPPNVRFILDDSGSMERDYMPDGLSSAELRRRSYINNSIFYNPATTYQAWVKADGTRYTTGVTLSSVHTDINFAGDGVDTSNLTNSSDETQTYYVPKTGATDFGVNESFYRYQIFPNHSDFVTGVRGRIIRSEFTAGFPGTADLVTTSTQTVMDRLVTQTTTNTWVNGTNGATAPGNIASGVPSNFTLPALAANQAYVDLTFFVDATDRDPDLYVQRGSLPTTSTNDDGDSCSQTNEGNTDEQCVFTALAGGQVWHFGVRSDSDSGDGFSNVRLLIRYRYTTTVPGTPADAYTGVAGANCSTTADTTNRWRRCTYVNDLPTAQRPGGRAESDEKNNYATWYSYHRTRIKVAKAGASEAFSQIGSNLRIGFDSINRNTSGVPFDIPVGTDNGLFRGANKSTWWSRLHNADGNDSTPLRRAIVRAGDYFKTTGTTGPWGPESGTAQLTCRQNFAILTTDGYWNGPNQSTPDEDGTTGTEITSSRGQSYTYQVARPYCDNHSGGSGATCGSGQADTLADAAMKFWKNDLRTDLENNVPTSDDNPAFWQNMVTFGVSIGLKGTLDPKVDLPSITNGSKRWPNPMDTENDDRIDDLWHATVNSRGTFVVASNTLEFTRGLLDAFAVVAQRLGSASNVSANSTSFTANTRLFQASYVSGKWTGELASFAVTAAGVAANPEWEASGQIPAAASRNVYTFDGSTGTTFPTGAQVTALNQSGRLIGPVNGTNNAAYIKGVRTREEGQPGGNLRAREHLLGDIVNSSPIYDAELDALFVGSNSGMLHAVDAADGSEYFTYVPNIASMSDLASLSWPNYSNNHKYSVDGPVSLSSRAITPDRSLLIAGLGRGGKGVFGLDVTNPAGFDPADDVLWEMSASGDTDLGMVVGEILIAKLNDASGTVAAIFGNGINSSSGEAVLYVVNLETGELIQKIETGVSGDNGLFAPRGRDVNNDLKVDWVYAGDNLGNMWKFDFTGATASIAVGGTPMFSAGADHPLTGGVVVGRDPATSLRWIFFGSGRFISEADAADKTVQYMFGLIDTLGTQSDTIAYDELQERKIQVTVLADGRLVGAYEDPGPLEAGTKGYAVVLDDPFDDATATPLTGERVITRPILRGKTLVFTTIIPPPSTDSCEASGSGFLNAINAFTGSSTSNPYLDTNNDGVVDSNDALATGGGGNGGGSDDADGDGIPNDQDDDDDGDGTPDSEEATDGREEIDGMPTQPVYIEDTVCFGTSDGGVVCKQTGSEEGQPNRASWRELIGE